MISNHIRHSRHITSPGWLIATLVILSFLISGCGGPLTVDPPDATKTNSPSVTLESLSSDVEATVFSTEPSINPTSPIGELSTETSLPTPTNPLPPTQAPLPVRFAVIGDYGAGGQPEADVASLVKSWQPDFIVTVGDNNYPDGAQETIDQNIGQFFHDYIYPYPGQYGAGADANRFFPTLGNHDWNIRQAQAYLDYFTLPGNERYYDFTWGPVHIFAVDSDSREPDGFRAKEQQAQWLQERMAASVSPWKVVVFHHAPYSSGLHGSTKWMRWPFEEWGADAVLTGHDHTYERLIVGNIPYFINGVGGGAIYHFVDILPESQVRYNDDYGAMLVTATQNNILFEFYNRSGGLIDSYQMSDNPDSN